MKKHINKSMVLKSVVALVLVVVLVLGVTYSWIEQSNSLRIMTDKDSSTNFTAPLSKASDIDAEVTMSKASSNIDLGSYFYPSGDMHLAACSSNGDTFYFENLSGASSKYRIGTEDDINTNYISITYKINSPGGYSDFWFDEAPSITSDDNENMDDYARYSITVDGKTNVYSKAGGSDTIVTDTSGAISSLDVRKTDEYTFANKDYTDSTNNEKKERKLFTVNKNESKIVTFKFWLNNPSNEEINGDKLKIKMDLVSSWGKTRTITVSDHSNGGADFKHWIEDESDNVACTLYLNVKDLAGEEDWVENTNYFKMTHTPSGSDSTYTCTIPLSLRNEEICFSRDNQHDETGSTSDSRYKRDCNGKKVVAFNFWDTSLPNDNKDSTYTIIGNTYDDTMVSKYGFGGTRTNDGQGTWDSVTKITLNKSGWNYSDGYNFFLYDFTNPDDPQFYIMARDTSTDSRSTYIPSSSTRIMFECHKNNDRTNNIYYWGYASGMDGGKQTRGSSETTYTVTGVNKGYWGEAVDNTTAYFVNTLGWANVYAHAWNSNDVTQATGNLKMTLNSNGSYSVSFPETYDRIIFSGSESYAGKTSDLTFDSSSPYYVMADGKWYTSFGASSSKTLEGKFDQNNDSNWVSDIKLYHAYTGSDSNNYYVCVKTLYRNTEFLVLHTDNGSKTYYKKGSGVTTNITKPDNSYCCYEYQLTVDDNGSNAVVERNPNSDKDYVFCYNASNHKITVVYPN